MCKIKKSSGHKTLDREAIAILSVLPLKYLQMQRYRQ